MKIIKMHFKIISIFLSALILFQGCTVYKSAGVTLDQAVSAGTKTKIETSDNQYLKFERIDNIGGEYYGINGEYGDLSRTSLDEIELNKVMIKDITSSTLLTVGIILVSTVVIVVGVIAIGGVNMGIDGFGF